MHGDYAQGMRTLPADTREGSFADVASEYSRVEIHISF